jgi:CRISPR/Cas system-associated endoribonuclease Cas2
MLMLIIYDVSTASEGGKRRLRRVARACRDSRLPRLFSVAD